jgi:hypothetical protein
MLMATPLLIRRARIYRSAQSLPCIYNLCGVQNCCDREERLRRLPKKAVLAGWPSHTGCQGEIRSMHAIQLQTRSQVRKHGGSIITPCTAWPSLLTRLMVTLRSATYVSVTPRQAVTAVVQSSSCKQAHVDLQRWQPSICIVYQWDATTHIQQQHHGGWLPHSDDTPAHQETRAAAASCASQLSGRGISCRHGSSSMDGTQGVTSEPLLPSLA